MWRALPMSRSPPPSSLRPGSVGRGMLNTGEIPRRSMQNPPVPGILPGAEPGGTSSNTQSKSRFAGLFVLCRLWPFHAKEQQNAHQKEQPQKDGTVAHATGELGHGPIQKCTDDDAQFLGHVIEAE